MTQLTSSIEAVHRLVASGDVSATDLCATALARIEQMEPTVGAMCDVTAHAALDAARAIDEAVRRGEAVGRLAGIPIAVKSNIDTASTICSSGLPHLQSHRPGTDAPVVRRLRDAGAIILGTAKTDSGAFGVTSPDVVNPRFPDTCTGGSSGGSAAAVAAGFCMAALGTDTGGSVRIPAACCGIVGFKPTYGRVSTTGVRPLARSCDHVGVLSRSVRDARSVMEVIDPGLPPLPAATRAAKPVLGIAKSFVSDASAPVRQMVTDLTARCEALGYTLRDVELPHPLAVLHSHLVLSLTEAASFCLEHDAEFLHALPPTAQEGIALGKSYTAQEHLQALRQKDDFVQRMQEAFEQVDFLLVPTLPVLPPRCSDTSVRIAEAEVGLLAALIRYTCAFDQSGHPALAVPWRRPQHPHVDSIQLVGPLHADRRLLALGETLEDEIAGFGNAEFV